MTIVEHNNRNLLDIHCPKTLLWRGQGTNITKLEE